MYNSAQPRQQYSVMHRAAKFPVADQSLNRDYNQPRDDSFCRSFTAAHNCNLMPTPVTTSDPSHTTVSTAAAAFAPQHSVQAYGQSCTLSATEQLTDQFPPRFAAASRANLDSSLLCSPWSAAQDLRYPSPQLLPATTAHPAPKVAPLQDPFSPLNSGNMVPPFKQELESYGSVFAYPTPGVTPPKQESSLSNGVVHGAHLGVNPPQQTEPVHWLDLQIQQNPPPVGLQGAVAKYSGLGMLGASTDSYLRSDDPDVLPPTSLLYLPEWTSNTTTATTPMGEYSAGNQFQLEEEVRLELAEDWVPPFRDTVDPSELGSLDDITTLDEVDSIVDSTAATDPHGVTDGHPFGALTNADATSGLTDANQLLLDPFIADYLHEGGDVSVAGFDINGSGNSGPVLTGEHGGAEEDSALQGQQQLIPRWAPVASASASSVSLSSSAYGEDHRRRRDPERRNTSRDEELIELRMRGVPYRDIKQKYGFNVAESTLRGRVRSLTKAKEQRVRKPVWTAKDISLLCSCVIEFAIEGNLPVEIVGSAERPVLLSEQSINKVSWKRVAEMMAERGSYHYGNATAKKKYTEVRNEQLTNLGLL